MYPLCVMYDKMYMGKKLKYLKRTVLVPRRPLFCILMKCGVLCIQTFY